MKRLYSLLQYCTVAEIHASWPQFSAIEVRNTIMKITAVRIENFRSIKSLDIELGDTTVFIGLLCSESLAVNSGIVLDPTTPLA
jgi:hypothetical protein